MSLIGNHGSEVGLPCPKCRKGTIRYNGNYFCEYWDDGCDWALSHGDDGEPTTPQDRTTWKKIRATPWYRRATKQ